MPGLLSLLCRETSAVVFCLEGSLQFRLAMVKSVEGDNSVADEKIEELVPPIFVADLAPNVRDDLIAHATLFFGVMLH
jgi:hypothetical protein